MSELSEEDLSARARIREVALAQFAERGVKATTIRGIADAAGVSLGLVRHHFGSKDELREACDAYVLGELRTMVGSSRADRNLESAAFIDGVHKAAPPLLRYLARALVDGSPAAAAMFDELVALTEEHLSRQHAEGDHRARATVLTAMKLGIVVLNEHVTRALGSDAFAPRGAIRVGRAQLEMLRPDFLGEELFEQAETGLRDYEEGHR